MTTATRYVLFWFDVEDCSLTHSDDAAKRLCEILLAYGVRGTMKVVGHKARVLRERIRYTVIDALSRHAIGFHSNWHGLRPQPAEYMGPLDWLEGIAEFERRERQGVDDLEDLFGRTPVCYGQPGSNWSPQVFPVLRKWNIPTYVSGYGYVGLHAQPFRYGGMVNTSHMHGEGRKGEPANHAFGLNFELGTPGALNEHKRLFRQSYEALDDGGMISIMNHPCTLVMKQWFSTAMKSQSEIDAGYAHFDEFIRFVVEHDDVQTITAEDLPGLYPDHAQGRVFDLPELAELALGLGDEILFQEAGGMALSAAELFGMFAQCLKTAHSGAPVAGCCRHLDGPADGCPEAAVDFSVGEGAFAESVMWTAGHLQRDCRVPDCIPIGQTNVSPGDYLAAMARAVVHLRDKGRMPASVHIMPTENRCADFVDEAAARRGWESSMMLPGFSAPKLLEQARLQSWTLKPALLAGG